MALLCSLPRRRLPAAAALFLLPLASCDWMEMKDRHEEVHARVVAVHAKRLDRACASNRTYDRLKDLAFNAAIKIRNADPTNLDRLATYSVVRMDSPQVKSRDERLDVTVCRGRFILYVPPGAERGFNGETSLAADVEYTAQQAADGSGLVYQMTGADPIIYRLAAFDLQGHKYTPPPEEEEKMAEAAPVAPPAAPPAAVPAEVRPAVVVQAAQAPPAGRVPSPAPVMAAAPVSKPAPAKGVVAEAAPPVAKTADRIVRTTAAPQARAVAPKPIQAAVPVQPASLRQKQPMPASLSERPKRASQTASVQRWAEKAKLAPTKALVVAAVRPRAGEDAALASPMVERRVQIVRADPSRPFKADARKLPLRTDALLPTAQMKPARGKQPVAASAAPAKRPPIQLAKAAPAQPLLRRAAQTTVGAPLAPPKPKPAVAPARPSLLARLPGLSALFATPEPAARKAAPPAASPRLAAPAPDRSIAASRSTKLAEQTARNPAPRRISPPQSTAPATAASDTPRPAYRAPRPSYDCGYARSRGEQMVCENGRLASLDRSVRRLYAAAIGSADGETRYELQRTRQRYLTYLDSCRTESCMARIYQGRMAEIREIMMQN
jgi:hypothetical protein